MTDPKRAAGEHAASLIENGMTLGLGTGSTAEHFLQKLGERIRLEGLRVRGVPTSGATEAFAEKMRIPLVPLAGVHTIDVTIDGADEIDNSFRMIKGGGGALLREKVVASLTRTEIIVVGENKVVEKLGTTFALPIEVVPFAVATVTRAISPLGTVTLRKMGHTTFVTDNGNYILDLRLPAGIEDPPALEAALDRIPGIVEIGLFIGLAHRLIIGKADGTVEVRDLPHC
ncbi:MAG: ribose-5-phosphate isomerase RpiA [Planctomycetota bacterium]